jgi:hypothetical protein
VEILEDFFGLNGAGQIFARWAHYLAGAAWVGLLYFFNFVQAPAFAQMNDASRADALREISLRAMNFRRWCAAATVATGVLILVFQKPFDGDYLEYLSTAHGLAVAFGSALGLIMFANVWWVIVPNQRIVVEAAEQSVLGRGSVPHAGLAARRLARAERCNALLSIPMLWFMAVGPHFAGGIDRFTTLPGRDYIGSAWAVFIITVGVIELSALGQLGGYDSRANKVLFDNGRMTLLWGVLVWALLWIGAFELILGAHPTA